MIPLCWLVRLALLAFVVTLSTAVPPSNQTKRGGVRAANLGGYSDAWWLAELQSVAAQGGNFPPTTPSPYIKGTHNIIAANGYPVEDHTVQTEDGYLLGLFRIPQPGCPVVFLMHGLFSSSADYVVTGRNRSLPMLLHDAGYDVWMGNARGNTASRRHVTLQPTQPEFWDFSWHEIGAKDLPACIDYVLQCSCQDALHYIGHSQGTTTFFVLGSERPQYMSKIKTYCALAPSAFFKDTRSQPLRLLALGRDPTAVLLQLTGQQEFLPNYALIATLGDLFCSQEDLTNPVCWNLLFLFCGTDTAQMDQALLPQVFVNTPAGSSTKQVMHYGQLIDTPTNIFNKYDYGWLGNLLSYGSLSPPPYALNRVTATTYLFYAANDILAVPENVMELQNRLPNIAPGGVRLVNYPAFNHLDFLFALDVKTLVNDPVIAVIDNYEATH